MEEKIELPKGVWNEVAKYKEIKSFSDNPKYELKDEFKYFTPSIEDIRVEYECELFWNQDYLSENFWDKIIIGDNGLEDVNWYARIAEKTVRTPYLTKEQIENEGWEFIDKYSKNNHLHFYRKNRWLEYDNKTNLLKIIEGYIKSDDGRSLARFILKNIKCLSINEFRYLIKLISF